MECGAPASDQCLSYGDHPKKLNIGAGDGALPGWLNTDLLPTSRAVVYLDATRRFPFDDDTFDYVFSEHMIEHVDYAGALRMLRECHRVLKPGGKIRIATPDLEVLIGLHAQEKTAAQKKYVDWIVDQCLPLAEHSRDVFVINNAFRAWGHQFLYDRKTLQSAAAKARFEKVKFYKPGASEDRNLVGSGVPREDNPGRGDQSIRDVCPGRGNRQTAEDPNPAIA